MFFSVDKTRLNDKNFVLVLYLFGISLPFLLVKLIHFYHVRDIVAFREWADCLGSYQQDIYLRCKAEQLPNYPTIGIFLTGGVIHALQSAGIADGKTLDFSFRLYLACFDALNFLSFTWLASLMKFRFPYLMGFLLLVAPSTLFGGAVWGQIDNISLSLGLFSAISVLKLWFALDEDKKQLAKVGVWLILATFSTVAFFLVKQLSIFSIPFFLLIFFITVWKLFKKDRQIGISLTAFSFASFLVAFRYLDSLFNVPNQFHGSSLLYVLTGGGSYQAHKISGNGFNIWMFLGRDMMSSSHVPLPLLFERGFRFDATPYSIGWFLYSILMIFLLVTGSQIIWQFLKKRERTSPEYPSTEFLLSFSCFFLGLSHLGFNILLAGTHERYLYLGYPFLLISIAWFSSRRLIFSKQAVVLCFLAASAYGFFILSVLKFPLPGFLFPLKQHQFLASIHLFLLVFLLQMWLRFRHLSQKVRKSQYGV